VNKLALVILGTRWWGQAELNRGGEGQRVTPDNGGPMDAPSPSRDPWPPREASGGGPSEVFQREDTTSVNTHYVHGACKGWRPVVAG